MPFEPQYHQEIMIEDFGYNNTLAPYFVCKNDNDPRTHLGGEALVNFTLTYVPDIVARLQPQLQGFNLTIRDVYGMLDLCAYETVALGDSSFCELFTEQDFLNYNYGMDLAFHYSYGFGSPTTAAIGIGWVQELASRLSQTAIPSHNSSTNGTLDDDPVHFPLDQSIYVDATHDTLITAVLVALNFTSLAASGSLPSDRYLADRSWVTTEIAPFAANLIAQVLDCDGSDKPSHIRFVLNEFVLTPAVRTLELT